MVKMTDIRRLARKLGLRPAATMRKGELIRRIQRAEGNPECYGSEERFACQRIDCCWRDGCLSKRPG